ASWPILRRLGVAERVRQLSHAILDAVEFIAIGGQKVVVDLPTDEENDMIAIKRSLFDNLLLSRARELGVEIHEKATVTALSKTATCNCKIDIVWQSIEARLHVGADRRHSTVPRLRNLLRLP